MYFYEHKALIFSNYIHTRWEGIVFILKTKNYKK